VDHRQGFLVSAVVHLTILTLLVSSVPDPDETEEVAEDARQTARVFMPPAEVLRQMAPAPAPAPPPPAAVVPVPTPAPAPTPPTGKDRISVGAPSPLRQQGPLILERDQDLMQVPKGRPDAVAAPTPAPAPETRAEDAGAPERAGNTGLQLPPGLGGALPTGADGSRESAGPPGSSLRSSLRDLQERGTEDSLGLPSGVGQRVGPLFFDPKGADFTRWLNHFKKEVFKNWLVPQGALLGFGGDVKIEFTVQRDGTMTGMRLISSAGTPALDKAAQGALLGSLLLPLPDDYAPASVTILVTFQYGRG
jgi:protein TonB